MSDLVVGGGSSAKRARRSWTIDEKRAIVDAATHSGDPVSVVARRHGLNANHLFKWLQPSVSQAPLPAQIDLGAPDSQYFYPRMLTYLLKGRFGNMITNSLEEPKNPREQNERTALEFRLVGYLSTVHEQCGDFLTTTSEIKAMALSARVVGETLGAVLEYREYVDSIPVAANPVASRRGARPGAGRAIGRPGNRSSRREDRVSATDFRAMPDRRLRLESAI